MDKPSKTDCDGVPLEVFFDTVITTGFTIIAVEKSNNCGGGSGTCYQNYKGNYISASNLHFDLNPVIVQSAFQEQQQNVNPFSIISSAYACLPGIQNVTAQEIIDLKVYSNHDFNNSYPLSSNLAHILTVTNAPAPITLDSFVVRNKKSLLINSTEMDFNTSPTIPSEHVLSFVVTLGDSSQLTFKTDTLRLN